MRHTLHCFLQKLLRSLCKSSLELEPQMILNCITHINLDLKLTLNDGCKLQNTDPDLISLKVCIYPNLTFWLGAVSTRSQENKILIFHLVIPSMFCLRVFFFTFSLCPCMKKPLNHLYYSDNNFLSSNYIIPLMRATGKSAIFHFQRHYYSLIFCICRHHSTLEMWLNV